MIKDFHKTAIVTAEREVSYAELLVRIRHFAALAPSRPGERVVIFSENREGWVYAFYAVWHNQGIAVPVDATSTVADLAYILGDCQPRAVWVSQVLETTAREALRQAGADAELLVIDRHERAEADCPPAQIDYAPEDTALIIYTSGTTGQPKGVMLSFANLLANVYSVSRDVPIFNTERRTMVLLPLHHVLPLLGSLIAPLYCGGGIAISPGLTAQEIMDTLFRGKVGIIIGVPRLWQTLYAGIKKRIDGNFATRLLFRLCQRAKSRRLSRLVFRSVRAKMGGHVDICASGGAALDKELGAGLTTLGFDIVEGYGMTETAPMISFTRLGDFIPGCSGKPLPGMEVKLVDGEICVKGPNLMQGYYRKPEATAEAIDSDGFLHTGDLGRFDEEGRLYITGRRKELLVLPNGKNVQPVEIESRLESRTELVKEAAITQVGDTLCAIIVPQEVAGAEERLKREVLEPYNRSTEPYKRVLRLVVWDEPLPRTRLDKLRRHLLPGIAARAQKPLGGAREGEEQASPEFLIIKEHIEEEKRLSPRPSDHIETDLGFDSLDKVWLQGFIEQTFGARVDAAQMGDFPSLAALAEHVAREKTRMEAHRVDWHELLSAPAPRLSLPSSTVLFPLSAKLARLWLSVYHRLELRGVDNIPETGPCILAPNHQSFMDGGLVLAGMPWSGIKHCYFYATEEHVATPLTRFMARHSNVVVMERRNLKDSIQKLAQVLRQGRNIILFPEGSRTYDGRIGAFKKTFAILAQELGVPIVPVCIRGAFEAWPRTRRVARPRRVRVDFLAPVVPRRGGTYDELSRQVRSAIEERLQE